jgi:dephospho-CoA kinase
MLKVGITGGMGSGKSTVSRFFYILGIPVYSADDAGKRLMATDLQLRAQIIENFGEGSYEGGSLNRAFLAEKVFNDVQKLVLLNGIVHPAVIKDGEQWMQRQQAPYVLKEAAILFESGSHKSLDLVIGVFAPLSLRMKRILKRDGLTEEQIMERISKQMDEEEKMGRCDFVVVNDEDSPIIPQVLALHRQLLNWKAV